VAKKIHPRPLNLRRREPPPHLDGKKDGTLPALKKGGRSRRRKRSTCPLEGTRYCVARHRIEGTAHLRGGRARRFLFGRDFPIFWWGGSLFIFSFAGNPLSGPTTRKRSRRPGGKRGRKKEGLSMMGTQRERRENGRSAKWEGVGALKNSPLSHSPRGRISERDAIGGEEEEDIFKVKGISIAPAEGEGKTFFPEAA